MRDQPSARKQSVTAPGAVSAETGFDMKVYAEGRNQKKTEKLLKQSYEENVEATIKGTQFDEASQKDLREYLSNPWVKAEVVKRTLQMEGDEEGVTRLLKHVMENKDAISNAIAEKQKTVNSLKGKKNYWKSQLNKLAGTNGDLAQKIKDIGSRVKQLEKQIRDVEKSRLDLSVKEKPRGPRIATAEEINLQEGFSSEAVKDAVAGVAKKEKTVPYAQEMVLPESKAANDDGEAETGFEEPAILEPTKAYKTKREKTAVEPKPEEAELVVLENKPFAQQLAQTGELDQQNKFPERVEILDRKANVGGIDLSIHRSENPTKYGHTYTIDLPGGNTGYGFNARSDAFAEKIFNFAMVEAGKMKGKPDYEALMSKIKFVVDREKNLVNTRSLQALRDKQRQEAPEPQPNVVAKMKDKSQRAREMPVITPDMLQQDIAGARVEPTDESQRAEVMPIIKPKETPASSADTVVNRVILNPDKFPTDQMDVVVPAAESYGEKSKALDYDDLESVQDTIDAHPKEAVGIMREYIQAQKERLGAKQVALDLWGADLNDSKRVEQMVEIMSGRGADGAQEASLLVNLFTEHQASQPKISSELGEQANTEADWWNQSGVDQLAGAWQALDKSMGGGAAEASLLTMGVPKGILKKYGTPQALSQFLQKPGLWARINGDAAATREALNRFVEEANNTRKIKSPVESLAKSDQRNSVRQTSERRLGPRESDLDAEALGRLRKEQR